MHAHALKGDRANKAARLSSFQAEDTNITAMLKPVQVADANLTPVLRMFCEIKKRHSNNIHR